MLEKMAPIMPSRDIDATERFYAAIGFQTVFKDGSPGYLLMKREGAEVHFFFNADHDPKTSDHGAYLRPSDIDAFSSEIEALNLPSENELPRFVPARDMPWGMREATIWDPDGNLLRAGQEIPKDAGS